MKLEPPHVVSYKFEFRPPEGFPKNSCAAVATAAQYQFNYIFDNPP
jgi:hypothetical protein